MAQRTVKAKEIVQDIRSHMNRAALMEKYHISAGELALLLKKLVELRVLATSEVEGIASQTEAAPAHVFECPDCGTTDASDLDECPHCGAIVAKIEAEMIDEEIVPSASEMVGQPAGLHENKPVVAAREVPVPALFRV